MMSLSVNIILGKCKLAIAVPNVSDVVHLILVNLKGFFSSGEYVILRVGSIPTVLGHSV
jgi:hypothetical protein